MRILDYTPLAGLHINCRQTFKRLGEGAAQLRLCEEKVFRVWGPNEVAVNTGRSQFPSPGRVGCVNQNNPTSERGGDPPPVRRPTAPLSRSKGLKGSCVQIEDAQLFALTTEQALTVRRYGPRGSSAVRVDPYAQCT